MKNLVDIIIPHKEQDPDAQANYLEWIQENTRNGNMQDKAWRLNNLYYVDNVNPSLGVTLFTMEPHHYQVFSAMHGPESETQHHIILKARQVFMTSYTMIDAIDECVFRNRKMFCLLINMAEDESSNTLQKKVGRIIELSPILQTLDITVTKNVITFNHTGSEIACNVAPRSNRIDYLHITEFGKMSKDNPKKAKEIKDGAMAAVEYGIMVVESTSSGPQGLFSDITRQARQDMLLGLPLTRKSWLLHFFPWWGKKENVMPSSGLSLTIEQKEKFALVEKEMGMKFTVGQINWWKETLKNDFLYDITAMNNEHPTSIDDCFDIDSDSAIMARQVYEMERNDRIREIPMIRSLPVLTFWDFGFSDETVVLFAQAHQDFVRIFDAYSASGEDMQHYFGILRGRNYSYGMHVLPWDARMQDSKAAKMNYGVQALMPLQQSDTYEAMFHKAGYNNTLVMDVCKPKKQGFSASKELASRVLIDRKLAKLVTSLKNAERVQIKHTKYYEEKLVRNEATHYYDTFELVARFDKMYGGAMWSMANNEREVPRVDFDVEEELNTPYG